MCLLSQPVGNAGGYSYLYKVNDEKFSEFTDGVESVCGENKIIRLGNVSNGKSQAGMVYSIDGVSQTLCACTHGYAIGYIKVK